jgi:hypothetical protein
LLSSRSTNVYTHVQHRRSSVRTPYFTGNTKVTLSLSTPCRYTVAVHAQFHLLLTSTPDGTHSRSELFSERENLLPLPGFKPRTAQPATSPYTYYTIPAPYFTENAVYLATLFVRTPQQIGQYRVVPRTIEPYFDSR